MEEYSSVIDYFPADLYDELEEKYGERLNTINRITNEYEDLFAGKEEDTRAKAAEMNQKLKEAGIDEVLEWIEENLIPKMNGVR